MPDNTLLIIDPPRTEHEPMTAEDWSNLANAMMALATTEQDLALARKCEYRAMLLASGIRVP